MTDITTATTSPATFPVSEPDWSRRARRLATTLAENGDVRDAAWEAAVAAVPRHRLVPAAYTQDAPSSWRSLDLTSDEGLDMVYSPTTLVTALQDRGDYQAAVSSSTKPDLMVRMLEVLDVHPGHRVLEIGTGTGYNAALLTHRLGDTQVYSVDIDQHLVDSARARLAEIGYHPTLVATDGADGLAAHGPYDRIIATCSVPAVPWTWVDQLTPGGQLLADLKTHDSGGNLVALRRLADRAEGKFTARWAAFMAMRHHGELIPIQPGPRAGDPVGRMTTAPAQPWRTHRVVWFLAGFALPAGVGIGMRLDPDTHQPTAGMITAPDGSNATIELIDTDGVRQVTEAGPTPLWSIVEDAYQQWIAFGEPDWPRLGLTVTKQRQWVWLDDPIGPNTWPITCRT